MQDAVVCPYYDHDEDVCDVGCGYISSHDASMIIKFCSCQYQDCHKFLEISHRLEQKVPPVPSGRIETRAKQPVNYDRQQILGLSCYSISVASYAADKLPVISINLHLMALIIMLGAIGQIYAGLNSMKFSPLRSIAFTGFGLFWLSILALDILPRAGYGTPPGSLPMMGYFAMWGMFSLVICQGLELLTLACRGVFTLMTAFLLLLAMAHATGSIAVLHSAALLGLASSLPGIYLGLRQVLNESQNLLHHQVASSNKVRS